MPCAYHIEGNYLECQFKDKFPDDELMEVDDKKWCPFHAPLEDEYGQPTAKEKWSGFELKKFYSAILKLRENAITENKTLNFSGVVFPDDAKFQGREFPDVDFSHALFNGHAYFFNAKFKKTVSFQHSKFSVESANFRNVEFNGLTIFQNARFEGRADFRTMGNNSDVDAFHDVVNFEGVEFFDYAIFENRYFRKRTIFKNCTFHKAPHFHGCRFHQDTDFTDARFLDKQGDEAAISYRTLKLDMGNKMARQEQLIFYALEMKSRRQTEKRKILKFISWMYEATSDYGQRIFLPLAWLGYLFLLFTLFYAAYFKGLPDLDAASVPSLAFHFSIKQIVRPFGVFSSSTLLQIPGKALYSSITTLPLIIAATLQSFLSLALLLLSGLAARWRFKIG